VKNNVFEQSNMKNYSSTAQKQNQHWQTPLTFAYLENVQI